MRPALKSGLLPVWRDRDTLQIGIDPRRAIALTGMSQAAILIGILDGSRNRDQVVAAASLLGIPVQATERVLTLLAAGGVIDDFPATTLREVPGARRARLAAELATTSLAHRDSDGGARALARRRASTVCVEGAGPIAQAIARILSASGIGHVQRAQPATTLQTRGEQTRGEQTRAGQTPAGETRAGQTRACQMRARRAIVAARPDLVILVGSQPLERTAGLTRDLMPHLAVTASEAIGVVGPLVVPGSTACLRCLDFFRAGSDPAWPLILAQLASRRPEPPACDAVLAATVAAQAAAQTLIAVGQAPGASAAANGTLELVLPDWRWQRRTWARHPACACTSYTTS